MGTGFLEKVYENALYKKICDAGIKALKQYPIKVYFEDEIMGEYCADLYVDDKILVELKAVDTLNSIHEVQLVNYLKATGIEVGLLLNFGKNLEIKRKVFSENHKIHNNSMSKNL